MAKSNIPYCSFCHRSSNEAGKLITGPDVFICERCINMCNEILREEKKSSKKGKKIKLPLPSEILEELNKYVIGQDEAKKALSVLVYNHYKRINNLHNNNYSNDDVEIEKSNILLLGPTGSGKTLLAQTLARILSVPFTIVDATILTEAGYVGEDVENILVRLLQAANYDVAEAEKGIIYIDEIDKISRRSANPSITRDVSGEGVQQGLLKILEGTVAAVPPKGGRKHPEQNLVHINTKNILFVCGGAFDGLENIISSRTGKGQMGFNNEARKSVIKDKDILLNLVEPEDLIQFGLIPELVGRLPILTALNELKKEDLVTILTAPKNSIVRQFKKLLKIDNVELTIKDCALNEIADISMKKKTGARGLRLVLEKRMIDIMYKIPDDKSIKEVIIDAGVINGKKEPEYVFDQLEDQEKLAS